MSEQTDPSTQVRTFTSLEQVIRYVDSRISNWKSLHDKYNERLGLLLRDKPKPASMPKPQDKEKPKPNSTTPRSSSWFVHEGIKIYRGSSLQGESEIILAASQDIKVKLDKLEKSKKALNQMGAKGIGNGTLLLACLKDGLPDRIALMPMESNSERPRFNYSQDFSVS